MAVTSKEFAESKDDGDNLFPKPTDAQEGIDILIRHFLGDDWYVVDPLPASQINTVAIYQILKKTEKITLWERVKNCL